MFTDPYAANFLDTGLKVATRMSGLPGLGGMIWSIVHEKALGAMSSGIARTKYIDDLLRRAVLQGSDQVVILGAGFDTRAHRLTFLGQVPVIEVDHPDTSKFKVGKLAGASRLNANTRYLTIDFNMENLDDRLNAGAIDTSKRTAFVWEGVTNYLTPEAVQATFRSMGRFPSGSSVIFTYIHKDVLNPATTFDGIEEIRSRLDRAGEHWTFGFNPDELPEYLGRLDLELLEDKGAADYRDAYMPDRPQWHRGYEFYRVACARRMDASISSGEHSH